jgi:hypothetical protein
MGEISSAGHKYTDEDCRRHEMSDNRPTQSGITLGATRRALLVSSAGFVLADSESRLTKLSVGGEAIRFLTACPDGEHFAFWSDRDGSFCLMNTAGETVWRRGVNTDKTLPHDIRFSPSGDVVACFDDWDGGHRIHLFNIHKRYENTVGPSWGPVIHDILFRRFSVIPNRYPTTLLPGGLVVYEPTAPPDEWKKHQKQSMEPLVICDRRGSNRGRLRLPFSCWESRAVAFCPKAAGFVVVYEQEVMWFDSAGNVESTTPRRGPSMSPATSRKECLAIEVNHDLALLRSSACPDLAVASRPAGKFWSFHDALFATVTETEVVLVLERGAATVVGPHGPNLIGTLSLPVGTILLNPIVVDGALHCAWIQTDHERIKLTDIP